jgi:hypothetical protein
MWITPSLKASLASFALGRESPRACQTFEIAREVVSLRWSKALMVSGRGALTRRQAPRCGGSVLQSTSWREQCTVTTLCHIAVYDEV